MKSAVLKVVDMHGSTRRYILQLYTVSFHFDSFRYVSVFDPLYCVSFIANQLSSITLVNPLKWISCQIERKSKLYTSIQRMVERVFFWVGTKINIAKSGRCQSRNWAGLHIFSLWRCRSMIFCGAYALMLNGIQKNVHKAVSKKRLKNEVKSYGIRIDRINRKLIEIKKCTTNIQLACSKYWQFGICESTSSEHDRHNESYTIFSSTAHMVNRYVRGLWM